MLIAPPHVVAEALLFRNAPKAKSAKGFSHRDVRRSVVVLFGFVFLIRWLLVNNEGLKGNTVMDELVF